MHLNAHESSHGYHEQRSQYSVIPFPAFSIILMNCHCLLRATWFLYVRTSTRDCGRNICKSLQPIIRFFQCLVDPGSMSPDTGVHAAQPSVDCHPKWWLLPKVHLSLLQQEPRRRRSKWRWLERKNQAFCVFFRSHTVNFGQVRNNSQEQFPRPLFPYKPLSDHKTAV